MLYLRCATHARLLHFGVFRYLRRAVVHERRRRGIGARSQYHRRRESQSDACGNGVLRDRCLCVEIWRDVERCVGDANYIGVGRKPVGLASPKLSQTRFEISVVTPRAQGTTFMCRRYQSMAFQINHLPVQPSATDTAVRIRKLLRCRSEHRQQSPGHIPVSSP